MASASSTKYTITTEAEEALTAATAETLLIVAGATTRKAKITGYGVSFDGVSSTAEPVQVLIKRGNSASQGTSTAATEEKLDPDSPTAACTGFHSFTAEPTYTGQTIYRYVIHPQGGVLIERGLEIMLDDATNSFIGIEVTAPAVVNATAWMEWEE